MVRRIALLFGLLVVSMWANAQVIDTTTVDTVKDKDRTTFFGIPLVFYTPETSWGFGGAAIYTWRKAGDPDSLLPSQIQVGGAYTLNNQILSYMPFQLYFKQNEYTIYGEVGYYRYNYNFYGIGNEAPDSQEENFGVTYPRVRINALKQWGSRLFVGVRHWFDHYKFDPYESEGLLATGTIPGTEGGTTSGSGFVANYDTRDYYFSSTKGWYIEAASLFFKPFLGSDYNFNKYSLDVTKYYQFPWKHALVGNFYTELNTGNVPFNMLALLGGARKMRGYYEGRFRDKNLLVLQAEYRADIWWRFGLVAFGGVANVAPTFGDLASSKLHYSYGTGLRIRISDPERLNMRLDAGFTETGVANFYITVREAF